MLESKDIEWLNGYKNKTHIYAAYKRLTSSDLKIQIESKWMEEGIPCKWKSKQKLRSNTYIRQNRL